LELRLSLNSGIKISRVILAASDLASFLELPTPFPYSIPLISTTALEKNQDI
jgi:hypothetical protein